jgi:peptide/nickel transport system substrate-binding protein
LWIAFNTTKKPLDDPRVRQAISFALDREFITKRLHRGRSQVSTGPIAPASPYYSKDVETYKVDLARAEKLLDEAGLKKDAQGIRFKTTITHAPGSRDFSANIVEYAKAQLKRIGIDLEINPAADFPSWAQKVGGHDFDMTIDAVFNWGDPVVGVHRTYLSSNIRKGVVWSNTQSYNNPKVDELLATAAVEPDEVKRKQLYAEFQRTVVADAPQAFLTVIPYYTVTVAGLKGIPTDIWSATSPIDMLEWE